MDYIVLTVTDRPHYLKQCLEALKNQQSSLEGYTLLINIELVGIHNNQAAIELCQNIDFIKTDVKINSKILGIKDNTYDVMTRAFDKYKARSVLYLEDDYVLSPDALDLWQWYLKQDLTNIALLCLFSREGTKDPDTLYLSDQMMGWGFALTKDQWEKYAKPVWLKPDRMWDNNMAAFIRTFPGVRNMFPNLSRATNVGEFGVHLNPQIFKKYLGEHTYNQQKKKFNYELQETTI